MMDNYDLKIIKKKYGEEMMHFCRTSFPTILETEGLLSGLLLKYFYPSRDLFNDLLEDDVFLNFRNFIFNFVDSIKYEEIVTKTAKELMDEAGYILYDECLCEDDIQSFKKYYANGEKLCTFNGDKLITNRVFFAVKKNVSDIRREDFTTPERQDLYGTSVLSIQFTRDSNTLSIKNRYNHRVINADATFSNNLENIIPGLTKAFEKDYGLVQRNKYELDIFGYVRDVNGKYYKYNYDVNDIYYCPDNIIIDNGAVKKYDKEKFIVMDYFILDLVNKRISLYDDRINDSFLDLFSDIKNISIRNKDDFKEVKIVFDNNKDIVINLNGNNKIIGIIDDNVLNINDNFLYFNNSLVTAHFASLKIIGNSFLYLNGSISDFEAFNVVEIGDCFLRRNDTLNNICLPNVVTIGDDFLKDNHNIRSLSFPNLEIVGDSFFYHNSKLSKFDAPNVSEIGNDFLFFNWNMSEISLPCLKKCGDGFLHSNKCLNKLYAPKVEVVGRGFLFFNCSLEELCLPSLIFAGNEFLDNNSVLKRLYASKLKVVGHSFLYDNLNMKELFLPDLEIIDRYFLYKNVILEKAILPKVKKTGYKFMFCNEKLYYLDMRSLVEAGDNFLPNNLDLNYVDFSNLKVIGENFFGKNVKIRNLTDINNKKNILRDMRKKLLDFDFHKKYEYVKKR